MNYLLRRPKLGNTSVKGICNYSKTKLQGILHTVDKFPSSADVVIRWGCTATIPHEKGIVINEAKAIHTVTNKAEFRKLLSDNRLAVPSWTHVKDWAKKPKLPVIIRPITHHQGNHLFFCQTEKEVLTQVAKMKEGYYISEFFNKTEEFRIFIAQGRVICVAKKTPGNPKDIAWNVAQGGRFDNVRWGDWDLLACAKAIYAMKLSGLHFGGVDIMKDKEGFHSILEINSAPSLTSEYRQECFAKVFDYIVNNKSGKTIPLKNNRGWRNFIHPAISNEAA